MATPVFYAEGTADFGNTLDTAFAIAPVSVVTGRISSGDWGDMFRIDVPEAGRISLVLDGMSARLNLVIVDNEGDVLRFIPGWNTTPIRFDILVPDGSWYVRVSLLYNAVSDYRLSVITTGPVDGTPGADSLTGGIGLDTLYGLGGDDTLIGLDNRDLLVGGGGNDRLEGGADADTLHGGLGDDTLLGGTGNDELYGGAGDDWLETGTGDIRHWSVETAWGGSGNDTVIGGDSGGNVNRIGGGAGNDLIDLRGPGRFLAWGGDGNDTIHASDGLERGSYPSYWGARGMTSFGAGCRLTGCSAGRATIPWSARTATTRWTAGPTTTCWTAGRATMCCAAGRATMCCAAGRGSTG